MPAQAGSYAEWSGAEIRELVRLYPAGGAKAVARALPTRSLAAIYNVASELCVAKLGHARGGGRRRAA